MKLFISSDIEGTCGICHWDETQIGKPGYDYFSREMTEEVSSCCQAALDNGAEEVIVKDAHDSARNIHPDMLPENVRLIREWATEPGNMMAGMNLCDAVAMTGYHSGAFSDGNPLAHTTNTENMYVKINGTKASEFMINAYYAAYMQKPVLFLSGDRNICGEAGRLVPGIVTAPVVEAVGTASMSPHPKQAQRMIYDGMAKALRAYSEHPEQFMVSLPPHFVLEIQYREMEKARRGSFYPGAVLLDPRTVGYETDDWYEALRFMYFTL